jgi:hypothetical protein
MLRLVKFLSLGIYSSAVYLYVVGVLWDAPPDGQQPDEHDSLTSYDSFGGRWKFLTIINMVMQAVYFSLCILNTSLSLAKIELVTLRGLLNFFFTSFTFPIGLVSCLLKKKKDA